VKWWRQRAAEGCPVPQTAAEAVAMAQDGCLARPLSITVKSVAGEKYDRVASCKLGPKSAWQPEPGWNDALGDEEGGVLEAAYAGTSDLPF
jgi:DNA repair protein RadD